MKFEKGDLVAEYMNDEDIYLIVLTTVYKEKAHGYIVDEISWDLEWISEGIEEPTTTREENNIYPIELKNIVLIEKGNTPL